MRRFLIGALALLFSVSFLYAQIGQSNVKKTKMSNNEKYVRALYKDVHGRDGEARGIKYWTDELENEMSREEVVKAFLNSNEYRGRFIRNVYGWFHDREPDEQGLKFWADYMKEHSEGDMIRAFVLSEEFWNNSNKSNWDWVENLYWTLQSRRPEVKGHDYWTKELKGGKTKEFVVGEFMKSEEYRKRMIRFLYDHYHKRQPDADGLKYWVDQLGELSERQIILMFLTGEEYWNRVTQ